MNLKHSWMIGVLIVSLGMLGACSKKQPAQEPAPAAPQNVQADAAPQTNNAPNAQNVPTNDDSAAAEQKIEQEKTDRPLKAIVPVDLNAIQMLEPEQVEEELLKVFEADVQDSADLKVLMERAATGDDSAKEAFVKEIFKRPHTDPHFNQAVSYLKTIREFKDPDVLSSRAILEFSNASFDPGAAEKAREFFIKAAELGHEHTLEFLLKNKTFGLSDYAFEKLNAIYEKKAQSHDPKVLYDWAKMLEYAPKGHEVKIAELLREASDAGYLPAQFTWAVSLLPDPQFWNVGYDLLKKAAEKGSEEANLRLANYYAVVTYSDNLADAMEVGGEELVPAFYEAVKAETAKAADPKMLIVEKAHLAGGFDEACGMLLAIASNEDDAESTLKARDYSVECIDKFVDAYPSRDACDRAFDQATYAGFEEFDFVKYYTLDQRTKLGQSILKCYRHALENGQDYAGDTPFIGFSTALQLATLAAGNEKLNIKGNASLEASYVAYAASHGDIIGQVIFGKDYQNGQYVKEDKPRACYWFQRAAASHICTSFCKEEGVDEVGTCMACKDAATEVELCKKASQGVSAEGR